MARDEGCSHQPQSKLFYVNWIVPVSDRVGTSIVTKCLKADFLGGHFAKNGNSSVSNRHSGTHLPGLHTRKTT